MTAQAMKISRPDSKSTSGLNPLAGIGPRTGSAMKQPVGPEAASDQYHVNADAVSGSIIQHSIEFGGASYLALST
jgi:hypothetical protein